MRVWKTKYSIITITDTYWILKERIFLDFSFSGELIGERNSRFGNSDIGFYNLIDAEIRLKEIINPQDVKFL